MTLYWRDGTRQEAERQIFIDQLVTDIDVR